MSNTIGQTTPIANTTSTSAAAAAATSTTQATQQEFLTLLVAQLQHQDPTQPMQGTDFITQLAQFSLVEQSVAQSTQLTNLNTQVTGLSNNETTQLVGQQVTLSGSNIVVGGNGASPTNVTLSSAAAAVTATISDSSGNPIQTLNLGAQPAGPVTIAWNGLGSNGIVQPAGTYSVNVSATDASGNPVNVSQNVSGVVTNVSFNQGYPEVTLASGAQAPISALVSVGGAASSPNP